MNLAAGVQIVSFGLLAAIILVGALGVVLLPNIVFAAFLLGLVFIGMAGQYLLLNADFVAAAQVLIYVGAVNVLILFAIMLVNKKEDFTPLPRAWVRRGATALVCLGLFALMGTTIASTPWALDPAPTVSSSVATIGAHFFSDFLLPFELVSVLLLAALIGAVVLARRDYLPTVKEQETVFSLPERPRELITSDSK